ncbi:hypothetical protein fugu_012090 [Takifugu bimaculatus]|uniref:ZP-C domain-containing protein n=1 Tax=Takifugu bimaculatus TaxID=433685 RepID=A0A4Z2C9K4_9TELE|nr:hypothetical protein fugu_012090 [Takifugu bimaculatus]
MVMKYTTLCLAALAMFGCLCDAHKPIQKPSHPQKPALPPQTKQTFEKPLTWKYPEDPKPDPKIEVDFQMKYPVAASTVAVECRERDARVEVKRDLFGIGQPINPADLTLGKCPAIAEDPVAQVLIFESDLHECDSSSMMTGCMRDQSISTTWETSLTLRLLVKQYFHVPLRVYMQRCVATVLPDPESFPRYVFIENGCLLDGIITGSASRFIRKGDNILQLQQEAFLFESSDVGLSRYQKYLAPPCGSEDQPQLRDASAPQAVDSSTLRMLSTESGACRYGSSTDVAPTPLRISSSSSSSSSSAPPPVSACLRTAGLPACSRSAPEAASPQRQTFGPNAHSAPLCSAWTRREAAGLRSRPRRRSALSQTAIRCLLPAHPTSSPPSPALVDGCGCRFDGAEKARLIEGSRPGGICGAADRDGEKAESGGKTAHWRDCDCEWTALHP